MKKKQLLSVIRLGMTREKVKKVLGKPDAVGVGTRKYPRPCIWKYGKFELTFAYDKDGPLLSIVKDHKNVLGSLEVKTDGTVYLCHIVLDNDTQRWELVHWGKPVGASDPRGKPTWLNQIGFGLKIRKFLAHYPLSDII